MFKKHTVVLEILTKGEDKTWFSWREGKDRSSSFLDKRSQDPSTGENLLFWFFNKRYQLVLGCAALQGSRVKLHKKAATRVPTRPALNRKGLRHIANSLKEITTHHVGNVPSDSDSQKRSLHFQIDTEVNMSRHQATQCYPVWLWPWWWNPRRRQQVEAAGVPWECQKQKSLQL